LSGTVAGAAAGLAPWSLVLPAAVFARRLRWPLHYAAATPLVFPALIYAVVRSAFCTLRQGGVFWRGTFYALDALRRGTVR
jgi:hypothetical protein